MSISIDPSFQEAGGATNLRSHTVALAAFLIGILAFATSYAFEFRSLADQDDDTILGVVEELSERVEDLSGVAGSATTILLDHVWFELTDGTALSYRSSVTLVRNPQAVTARYATEIPYNAPTEGTPLDPHAAMSFIPRANRPQLPDDDAARAVHLSGFLVRGGKVVRLDKSRIVMEDGIDGVHEGRIILPFPSLIAGDVIGWTHVREVGTLESHNETYDSVGPTVHAVVRIETSGREEYELHGTGTLEGQRGEIVTTREGKPTGWEIDVWPAAASDQNPDVVDQLCLSPGVSVRRVDRTASRFRPGPGETVDYFPLTFATVMLDRAVLSQAPRARGLARSITKGLSSKQQKSRALYEFVQHIPTLEGERVNQEGMRPIKEIIGEDSLTKAEKRVLLRLLLSAAKVPSAPAVARPECLGPVTRTRARALDFPYRVIRTGIDDPQYLAVDHDDLPWGELPEEWGDAWLVSPVREALRGQVLGLATHEWHLLQRASEVW